MAADMEELENLDASETHPRRVNAKEVLMPKMVKLSSSVSQMEQSRIRDYLARGEAQR